MASRKGGQFERDFCRILTAWWTDDPDADVIFWRTSQSGGRVTSRKKKGKVVSREHCGDVSAMGKIGRTLTDLVTIEVKRGYSKTKRKKGDIHDVLDYKPGTATQLYEDWINQASVAADNAGTPFWMLVHLRDGKRNPFVLFPEKLYLELKRAGCPIPGGQFNPFVSMFLWVRDESKRGREVCVCGATLDNFLRVVWPEDIRLIYRRLKGK